MSVATKNSYRKPGAEVETHKTLVWQAATVGRPGEHGTTPQRMIQNTTYIWPAAGGRGIKKP